MQPFNIPVLFFSTLLYLLLNSSYAQEKKMEREEQLKTEEVPELIKTYLAPYLAELKNLKFYRETDGEKKSYEAKGTYQKQYFSIEFSETLVLEDIEVTLEKLPENIRIPIKDHLSQYDKSKIRKIQRQFSSDVISTPQLLESVLNGQAMGLLQYEIVVAVKKDGKWIWYEMLFREDGAFLSQIEIENRSADFILY